MLLHNRGIIKSGPNTAANSRKAYWFTSFFLIKKHQMTITKHKQQKQLTMNGHKQIT